MFHADSSNNLVLEVRNSKSAHRCSNLERLNGKLLTRISKMQLTISFVLMSSFTPAENLRLEDCLPIFRNTFKVFIKIMETILMSIEERLQAVKEINDLFTVSLALNRLNEDDSKTRQQI